MKLSALRTAMLAALTAVAIAACAGPGATPRPATSNPTPGASPTAVPTATPTTATTASPQPSPVVVSVNSAAQAAALVFASDERWSRMSPLRADLMGQSTWYEASSDGDGFTVTINVGQGDCFAGCIEQHTWSYRVDSAGSVELVGEDGDDVDIEVPVGGDGPAKLTVQLTAGPTCPVEQAPPDPNCASRAVEGAEVMVYDAAGTQVAEETSDDDGMVSIDLPGGAYFVDARDVTGLMSKAEPQAFAFVGGDQVDLLFVYDTGIR